MHRAPLRYVLIAALAAAFAASSFSARTQPAPGNVAARPATGDSPAPVRTGKERLGEKWSDEQRVDNCKVPPAKRGSRPRVDTCPRELTH